MKKKNIFLLSLGLCLSVFAFGQDVDVAPELNATPPALADAVQTTPKVEVAAPTAGFYKPGKIQYQFSTGAQFSRFGSAAYFQPSILLPVTKRFSTFASLSFIQTYGSAFNWRPAEATYLGGNAINGQLHSVVQVGGNYMVNERLNLTGSVWRDFSKQGALYNTPLNVFSPGGTQGMQFRAHYKLTNNLSVSGGFRYSNGNNYYNPLYQSVTPWEY